MIGKSNSHIVQLLVDQQLYCGEGPIWDPDCDCLYWTDCGGESIYAKTFVSTQISKVLSGHHAASLALHASGGLVFAGRDGFFHWKPEEGIRLVANQCDQIKVHQINDIIADPAGRIFGGQEVFRENEDYETGYLFRVDTDGSCSVVEEGLHLSNGMGFSPACDRFYLIDSILRVVYAYDYKASTGQISSRKPLIKFSMPDGLPDGMTVDSEGYIWVAQWFGGAISRYDPDGTRERTIRIPAAQVSSLTFGGEHYKDIFSTSAAFYWETPLAPSDHDFSTNRGGGIYRITQDIKGKPEFKARV
jgi:sugar lactone lactonase YvrE